MTARKIFTIGSVSLAALLSLGAIAWACTPSSYLFPVSPASGATGTQVTIRGGQFGPGPVEIRWASESGRLLATALGPDFSAKVTIPERAEGVHYLVAVARDPADPSRIIARRAEAFEISATGDSKGNAGVSFWNNAGNPGSGSSGMQPGLLAGFTLVAVAGATGVLTLVALARRRAKS